ncbi:hypothetical protein [Propionivibrio sp.]
MTKKSTPDEAEVNDPATVFSDVGGVQENAPAEKSSAKSERKLPQNLR